MSIKRYLFMLIGGIVIGVAVVQLLLIHLFKQHLNEEIVTKSQKLSTHIIDLAVEQVELDRRIVLIKSDDEAHSDNQHEVEHHVNITPANDEQGSRVFFADDDCIVSQNDETQTTAIKIKCQSETEVDQASGRNVFVAKMESNEPISEQQLQQQKVIWKKQLHKIIEQKHRGNKDNNKVSGFTFISNEGEHAEFHFASDDDNTSTAVDNLVDYMMYLILASTVIALFVALWLSHHFTRPLQKLSHGFAQLEQGQFGVQVDSEGINEYRKTIHSFNQMSVRLAQLAESEKTLQQQGHLAELGEVSRGLAHALRNPMHTIGLSVEQLKDPNLPATLKAKLQDKIQAKIKHIDKTIKALLTLTSAEIQRQDEVPIRSVIQDVILEMKANGPAVKFQLNMPSNTDKNQPLTLKGAESEIRAIIHTLVVNAVEANDNQGEVTINCRQNDSHIHIDVIDQGQGIASSVSDRLFQPHVSSKAEGAGMGLYISKRLATLYYDGQISLKDNAENAQQPGCCATVTLAKGSQHE